MPRLLAALFLLFAPWPALGQVAQCSLPGQLPRPDIEAPSAKAPRRVLPIGSYTLALTWSPQHCSLVYSAYNGREAFQCGGKNGRFGFTLHGLWPDGFSKEWPQYCRPAALLPREVIRQNLCTTPSVQLLQHEWAKHGTCMATRPDLFFNLSRALYQTIRYPDMAALARQPTLTVAGFVQAFVRVNKGLRPDMIRVRTTRGNWLDELWLCMDRQMEFSRCPPHQRGADDKSILRIERGPVISATRPVTPAPVPVPLPPAPATARSSAAKPSAPKPAQSADRPASRPTVRPKRNPGLILDLDPKVQPLGNSAAK